MQTRSLFGIAVVAAVLAGCGSSAASPRVIMTRDLDPTPGTVYQWGRIGGALPNPGRPFGRAGSSRIWRHRIAEYRPRRDRRAILGIGPIYRTPTAVRGIQGTVTQVATSNSDGYALTARGAVYAWGAGSQGELGDGTKPALTRRAVRVRLPAGVRIAKLANPMPYNGAIAIGVNGTVWAWGNDQSREFCQPVGADTDLPVRVPLSDVTLAAGAWRHAIYDAAGRVVSCGLSDHGQLGDGTSGRLADSGTPVAVTGLAPGRVLALTSAFGNAGALLADGAYYNWGLGSGGQLGDGSTVGRATAVRVPLPGRARHVFEGGSFASNGQTIAILANGQTWVWGTNASGQLGDGGAAIHVRPVRLNEPPRARFVAVSSGGASDYAIAHSGELWAWGENSEGELGDASSAPFASRPVSDGLQVVQVSSTARNAAALTKPAS